MALVSTLTPQHLCLAWTIQPSSGVSPRGHSGHLTPCSTDDISAALQHLSATLRVLLAAAAGVSRPHTGPTAAQSPAPGHMSPSGHHMSHVSPAHLHMTRVNVTQPVRGVMADDAPGVAGNSCLRVVQTRLHVTPLPHQSTILIKIIRSSSGLMTYLTSPSSPQSRQTLSLKMILTGPVTLLIFQFYS